MTDQEKLFYDLRTMAKQTGLDAVTVALAFKDDPRFIEAVKQSRRDLEWAFQAWLHEPNDDSRRKFWEHRPTDLQISELVEDVRQQKLYCANCTKGDTCRKVTQLWLATLEQTETTIKENYVVYYPCKFNKYFNKPGRIRREGMHYIAKNAQESDLL